MTTAATLFKRPSTKWMPLLIAISATMAGLLAATQSIIGVAASFVILTLALLTGISQFSALAIMLILAPMRALLATDSPLALPLDIGQMTVILFVSAWFLHKPLTHRRLTDVQGSVIYLPLIVFIICTGLTVFVAHSLGAWLSEWLKWIFALILAIVVADIGKNHKWRHIILALIASGVANAIVGTYIFLGGSGADHFRISGHFFRAFGTFEQPNPFGGFMGLLAPIALMMAYGYFWINIDHWRKSRSISLSSFAYLSFYTFSAALLAVGVIISWSRGAWLSFGVSMGVLIIALPRKWWHSIIVAAVSLMLLGLLWTSGRIPASIVDRIESAGRDIISVEDIRGVDITTENYAVTERLAHWQAATNMLSREFWLGVGFGNYEVVYNDYWLINWKEPLGHAHNYYLNVLAEAGIIGFFGYAIMWIGIFWFTWRSRSHPDLLSRCMAIGLLGTWTYLAVHSLTDNLYVNNLFLHIAVMIGIVAILYRQTWHTYGLKSYDTINSNDHGN